MVFALCITSSFPISLAFIQDNPHIRVNVLLVCDDPFERVVYHMGALRWVPATQLVYEHLAMPLVDERFYNEFEITFYWDFGWQDWDSSDVPSPYNVDDMLDDAINDTGFQSGIIIDGQQIDILMAWTGIVMPQMGYAPAQLNACVIQAPILWQTLPSLAQHELSHLFNRIGHCQNNECVMNEDPNRAIWNSVWCDECFQIINSNKFKYGVTLSISVSSGGTTDPTPGIHYYNNIGESVTVSAYEYTYYTFHYWILDGTTFYNNPISVTMDSDHTLKAYFTSGHGGGGPFYPR